MIRWTQIATADRCETCGPTTREVAWCAQLARMVCLACLPPCPAFRGAPRRRARRGPVAIDELGACRRIAQAAAANGARAIVDPDLHLVATECPHCGPTDDPLWLPLLIIPRAAATLFTCRRCDHERVDVR